MVGVGGHIASGHAEGEAVDAKELLSVAQGGIGEGIDFFNASSAHMPISGAVNLILIGHFFDGLSQR